MGGDCRRVPWAGILSSNSALGKRIYIRAGNSDLWIIGWGPASSWTNPGNSMKHPIHKSKGDDHKLSGSHFLGYCYSCHFKGKAQRWPSTMTFWCPRSALIHWEKIKCLQHLLFNDFLLISDVEIQGFLNTHWFAFFTGKSILQRADLWQNSRWVVLIYDFFLSWFLTMELSPQPVFLFGISVFKGNMLCPEHSQLKRMEKNISDRHWGVFSYNKKWLSRVYLIDKYTSFFHSYVGSTGRKNIKVSVYSCMLDWYLL